MIQRFLPLVYFAILFPAVLAAQPTAEILIYHNSVLPATIAFDLYLNDVLVADNFRYHESTGYMTVPAEQQLTFVTADSSSIDANSPISSISFELAAGERYIIIASGVKNTKKIPGGNPDGRDILLRVFPSPKLQSEATDTSNVDFVFYHGVVDLEFLDVFARGHGNFINDVYYSDFSTYSSLRASEYLVDIVLGPDNNNHISSFDVDLSPYKGQSGVMLLGGQNSQNQSPGSPYGTELFLILFDGSIVHFPRYTEEVTQIQIIHNSPDPALETVDMYIDDQLVYDDMDFRSATSLITIPLSQPSVIGLAPESSNSASQAIVSFPAHVQPNENTAVFASGLVKAAGYATNPDGRSIEFATLNKDRIQSINPLGNDAVFAYVNSSTDLESIDFFARGIQVLQRDVIYGDMFDYQGISPGNYIIDIKPSSDPSVTIGSYIADLSKYGGRAGIIFTSGFKDTQANKDGPDLRLFVVFTNGELVEFPPYIAPSSVIQIVHNSPDAALEFIDVYQNDELLVDDLEFRKATKYLTLPADVEVTLAFAPGNSTGSGSAFLSKSFNAVNEKSYFVMLQGVQNSSGYQANPDGNDVLASITMLEDLPLSGVSNDTTETIFLPGCMDQAAIDLRGRSQGLSFGDAKYNEITTFSSLASELYLMDITVAGQPSNVFETYFVNFSSFGGKMVVLFTSGFVSPSENNNGPEYGLFGVFQDGRVFEYTIYVAPSADMQFIHNAADPSVSEVDVYVDDVLVADNFAFRTATAFLGIPASKEVTIGLAAATSTSSTEALITHKVTPENGQSYTMMFHGVVDTNAFLDNPFGASIALTSLRTDSAKLVSAANDKIEINSIHGVTDGMPMDITVRGQGLFLDNINYDEQSRYKSKSLVNGVFDVTPFDDQMAIMGSYRVDLRPYGGESGVLFISGFLSPEPNQNGSELGLFLALTDGTVIEFPKEDERFATLQIINNVPDPNQPVLDVWIGDEPFGDDLGYLTATDFREIRADEELTISIASHESIDPGSSYIQRKYSFAENTANVILINGVVNSAGFEPNPDGKSITLEMLVRNDVRLQSLSPMELDFIFAAGVPDAPTMDFVILQGAPLFENMAYNDMSDYLSLPESNYTFDFSRSGAATDILARFDGDISDLGGLSTLVFTTGFYDTTSNHQGPSIGFFAAFPNGSVVPFDKLEIVSAENLAAAPEALELNVYPNPAQVSTVINYSLGKPTNVDFKVFDRLGRVHVSIEAGLQSPGSHSIPINIANLSPGAYIVVMKTALGFRTRRLLVVH
jgi:uncharacterized protein DUF4397/type IX secretion system substrate protein